MRLDSPKPKTTSRKVDPGRPVTIFPVNEVRPGRESIIAGLIGTIVVNALLYLLIPDLISRLEVVPIPETTDSATTPSLDINLADEEAIPAPNKTDPRYVETNPDAPDKKPDETDAISARDQRAANEKEAKELSQDQTPAREGEKDLPFTKVVSGDLNPPVEVVPTPPPTPETQEQTAAEEQSRQRTAPAQGAGQEIAKSEEGPAPGAAEKTPDAKAADKKEDGKEVGAEAGAATQVTIASPARPTPAPRPRVTQIPPGPVNAQPAGVSETGYVGVSARFSQYGEYMERMVEAVTQRWHKMCTDSGHVESSTRVELEFTITRDGTIKNLTTVDTTAQALGTLLCRTAIEQGAPYGVWTKEMVTSLGDEQTIRFTFYYR